MSINSYVEGREAHHQKRQRSGKEIYSKLGYFLVFQIDPSWWLPQYLPPTYSQVALLVSYHSYLGFIWSTEAHLGVRCEV